MPVGMVGTHYEGGGTLGTMRLTEESFLLVAEGQKVQITVVFIDHLFKKMEAGDLRLMMETDFLARVSAT